MHIFVQTLAGKVLTLIVEPHSTISQVKSIIEDKEGIPTDQQKLQFGSSILSEDRSLTDCDIHSAATLILKLILPGGLNPIGLTFNALDKEVTIPFGEAPAYRIVRPGLSFWSKCLNPVCDAHDQVTIVNKGFSKGPDKKLNIAKLSVTLDCPICGKKSEQATKCGFYLSEWTFSGLTQAGEKVKKTGKTSTKNYHTWAEGDNINYVSLKVQVDYYSPD